MSTTPNEAAAATTPDYLLLFRGQDWDKGLSPEELQQAISKAMGWFEGLYKRGKVKAGQPLDRTGKFISGKKGSTVADGPFAESKEAIGGYLILQVANEAEAVAIAQTNPSLEYGITIEVRPILEECPIFKRANHRMNFAEL